MKKHLKYDITKTPVQNKTNWKGCGGVYYINHLNAADLREEKWIGNTDMVKYIEI